VLAGKPPKHTTNYFNLQGLLELDQKALPRKRREKRTIGGTMETKKGR